MSLPLRISDELVEKARKVKDIEHRSISAQIEYWAYIGKLALDNPDLPISFIKDILISKNEIEKGKGIPYEFGKING